MAGGDPVCWLHTLCPECGAAPSAGPRCWRCGDGGTVRQTLIFDADTLWENDYTVERAEADATAGALMTHEVELVAGVEAVLTELGGRHDLLMVIKGDLSAQQTTIDTSGVAGYFAGVHVVRTMDPHTYRRLVAELSLDPATTWVIGNSAPSDGQAARAAGLNAVLVPHPQTRSPEEAEIDDPAVLEVASLRDLVVHF